MPTLTLPLLDAKQVALALNPLTDRDNYTPILGNVAVGLPGGHFAMASDRYTAGRYDLTNVGEWPDERMLIPRELLSALLTVGPAILPDDYGRYRVNIETTADRLRNTPPMYQGRAILRIQAFDEETELWETHYLRVFRAVTEVEKYPNVARLFDTWVTGEPVYNPAVVNGEYLGRFTTYAHRTRQNMRLTLPAQKVQTQGSRPILVEIGTRFKGLVMPFTVKIDGMFGPDLAADNAARITQEQADKASQSADSPQAPDDTESSGI